MGIYTQSKRITAALVFLSISLWMGCSSKDVSAPKIPADAAPKTAVGPNSSSGDNKPVRQVVDLPPPRDPVSPIGTKTDEAELGKFLDGKEDMISRGSKIDKLLD